MLCSGHCGNDKLTISDDLRRVFEKYGEVGDVYIPRDRWTKESRGFAFVRYLFQTLVCCVPRSKSYEYVFSYSFHDRRDAEDAMDSLDGRVLDGRELRVQMARLYSFPILIKYINENRDLETS